MEYFILVTSTVWFLSFLVIAGLIFFSNRKGNVDAARFLFRQRAALGLTMVGAAAIPGAIEALASDGRFGWAGLPLVLAGIAVIFWKSRSNSDPRLPDYTFQEKSTAISLVLVIALYVAGSALAITSGGISAAIAWLIAATFLMIVLMAISHAVLALVHRPEPDDERSAIVALRSARNGYLTLCSGVWFCLGILFLSPGVPTVAFMIFGAFVLAEIVRMASALVYSRFGI